MSTLIKYNPDLLQVRRITQQSAQVGGFVLGASKLGATSTTSVLIEAATVTITNSYSPDDNGTLLVEAETATVSLSFWDTPGPLLYPGDRLEIYYDSERIFWGTVDTANLSYVTDAGALRNGAYRRVDFSASAAGVYAVAMGRIITYTKLPQETAIARIRRWVDVIGF